MMAFLDSSSLLKLYHFEKDSPALENYLETNIEELVLSELTLIEFRSAIWRKVRMNEIDKELANEVITCFEDDYDSYRWIKMNPEITKSAVGLIMKYGNKGLRTLDSLQLASALCLKNENCVFFTADNLLNTLFVEEKLDVVNF
jgi:predicted nucleic acid-binding protein